MASVQPSLELRERQEDHASSSQLSGTYLLAYWIELVTLPKFATMYILLSP